MAGLTAQAQEAVLQPTALQIPFERLPHVAGQLLAGSGQMFNSTDPGLFAINLVSAMDPDLIPELARRTAESGIANVPTQSLMEN